MSTKRCTFPESVRPVNSKACLRCLDSASNAVTVILTFLSSSDSVLFYVTARVRVDCVGMSLDLNDAAMSGNVEEVIIRLNMGEDPNQKFYPRYDETYLVEVMVDVQCS